MKKFIHTIKNIYSIEDLRFKILLTLGLIVIYRVGSFVILPGLDPARLVDLADQAKSGVTGLINLFVGGAFSRGSIFALGIMPYISASIFIQLLTLAVPTFQKLQKEGESGRKKINQYTRVLTILVAGAQAFGYIVNLRATAGDAIIVSQVLFSISTVVVLTAGTVFVMWLGERITEKGLGNGVSLIIMVGIIADLPGALTSEFASRANESGSGGLVSFLLELAVMISIVMVVILLVQGTRRIPVQYAKRIVGNRQYGGQRQYLPMKVNASGVMPIIFAQAIMFIPATVNQFFPDSTGGFLVSFSDQTSWAYNITVAVLIVLFTYFYTALIINPVNIADELKKNNGFIPGVKPGRKTAEFIDAVISRITLPGSLFLAFVAILPAVAQRLGGVNQQFAIFFGGTSLLIMVSVILDTLQQVETHLLNREYDGLMKSGRIKGRSTGQYGATV